MKIRASVHFLSFPQSHRKPGYDPAELFINPAIRMPRLRIAHRLVRKLLGFRYYMDLIGLDASIVKGSHGRLPEEHQLESDAPVFLCSNCAVERDHVKATEVRDVILNLQF